MRAFETIAAAYFLFFTVAATRARVPVDRAVRGGVTSCAVAILILALSQLLAANARVWLPLLYLPIGYWVPAMLTPAAQASRFESWLRAHDTAWRTRVGQLSSPASAALELAYVACYLIVPVALLVVWNLGTLEDVERLWMAVLPSGFACYSTLPWLVSRPPRFFKAETRGGLASFNVSLLRRVSHQLNTFPSGHVAVATAAAIAVLPVSRLAAVLLAIVAIGIAAGAAIGRYHYGVDVIAGMLVGIAAASVTA